MRQRQWSSREAKLLCSMVGETDAAVAIKRLAAELIDDSGLTEPPFDPEILASFQGVSEIRRRSMTSAARLIPELGSLVIEVNQSHTIGKQNLSVNHETCHTLMPTYSNQMVDDPETGRFAANGTEEEFLCDIGGAALLMDERWLRPLATDAGPSLASLFHLADLFQASLHATAWQIAELGLWPLAFVLWEEDLRKSERATSSLPVLPGFEELGRPVPKWRVKHICVSRSFQLFIPLNESVASDSLVATCGQTGRVTTGVEDFEFGNRIVRLYSENAYVAYRRGPALRPRVLSLLLPIDQGGCFVAIPEQCRQIEML